MRIAAVADLHFTPQNHEHISAPLLRVREEADLLVIAGDLTNHGTPEEMRSLLSSLVRLGIPTLVVLGNHDYESGQEKELSHMLIDSGIHVLDGNGYEAESVAFAGTKGFPGGFGRSMLTAFGEKEVKAFVQASLNETLKLERALSMLRSEKIVVATHYAPIADTLEGEPQVIWPFLGSSRLADVIDRHGAALSIHGHAHHGSLDGKTTAGVPVRNVALPLLMAQKPALGYRVFEV